MTSNTEAPLRPPFTITSGARSVSRTTRWSPTSASASSVVAKSSSGAASRTRSAAARRPRASNGPTDDRSRLTSAPAARASSTARRPARPNGLLSNEYAGR